MIKKLRKKFVIITAVSLLSVMLVLIAAINTVNIYRNNSDANSQIEMIIENDGKIPELDKKINNKNFKNIDNTEIIKPPTDYKKFSKNGINNPEKQFTIRFTSVEINKTKQITKINKDKIASLSESDIKSYTEKIINSSKTSGWISNYKYKIKTTSSGYLLVILDASAARNSNYSILLISSLIGIFSYMFVLLIIILISKKAISPIAESYEKQKAFITDAGHELKTPLTVISANNEILKMTYGENEWIDATEKQIGKMQNLVCNLISLAKMDEDNIELQSQSFSLSDAVYDTAKAFEGLCKSKNKTLSISAMPDINWTGDEASIRQVVSILLDNAVKYCDENGNISVVLSANKFITIKVTNTFKNVANTKLPMLFDRFYREDKARTDSSNYGLGLSIAKAVVEKQHGTIKAHNINNEEISFEIQFKKQ